MPMISFCTPNNDFIHAISTVKDEVFNGQNPVITAIVIALGTVTCIFLLTMLNRQYMVPCKPLAAPDSKPLINANIKWQVSREDGK